MAGEEDRNAHPVDPDRVEGAGAEQSAEQPAEHTPKHRAEDSAEASVEATNEASGEKAAAQPTGASTPVGSDEKKGGNKKLLLAAVAALAVLVILIQLIVGLGGKDDAEENEAAEETSVSAEASPTTTNSDPFVDDSGEQDREVDAAPGQFPGMEAMSLGIGEEYAAVDPIQVSDTGMLVPPRDVTRLGWYSASAVPGTAGPVGSSVITGHINYQGQGTGFAEKFTTLEQGQEFSVFIDGEERVFRVTEAPYRLPKGSGFPDVVNDSQGENRLVLITCGGKFVGGELGYEDNIITVAEPVAPVEAPADGAEGAADADGAAGAEGEVPAEAPAA